MRRYRIKNNCIECCRIGQKWNEKNTHTHTLLNGNCHKSEKTIPNGEQTCSTTKTKIQRKNSESIYVRWIAIYVAKLQNYLSSLPRHTRSTDDKPKEDGNNVEEEK